MIGWGPTQKVIDFWFGLVFVFIFFPSFYWATLKEKLDDWATLKEDLKETKREHVVSETLGNIVWLEEDIRIQILQVHYSFIRFVLPT